MNGELIHNFLTNLESEDNHSLIEAIREGYECIFEGYADVVDVNYVDPVSRMNRQAAYDNSLNGNNALSILQRSSEILNNDFYSRFPDNEPELDVYTTTVYTGDNMQAIESDNPYKDMDDDFDLTQKRTGMYNQNYEDDGIDDSFGFSSSDIDTLV